MAYLVGVDEAGYGPNLGPLVIAATVWRVPESLLTSDAALHDALAGVICQTASDADSQRLAIADSKKLYKPGGGPRGTGRPFRRAIGALGGGR